jgi:PAS domain S-box-containing protein
MHGGHTDLTARKQAEAALRLSEEKFAKAFRSSPDAIIVSSIPDSRITEVNDSVSRISGYAPEEMLGRTTVELGLWAEPGARDAYVALVLRDGRVTNFEAVFRAKSGTRRTCLMSTEILQLQTGPRFLSVLRDITERRQAEAALRESEERFRAYVEQAADAVFVHDFTGRFVDVNASACKSLGYSRDELLQLGVSDVEVGISPTTLPADWTANPPGRIRTEQSRQRRKDGSTFPVEVTARGFDLHGQRLFLCLVRDVTERKQVEMKLKKTAYLLVEAQRAARVGYYVTDLATGHWDTSPMLNEIFGIDADFPRDIPNWGRLIHPDDRAAALQHYGEVTTTTGQFRLDYRVIRPCDGKLCWVAAFGQFEYDEARKPVRLLGCIQDIHDRKQAEESLRNLEVQTRKKNELLRSILESPQGLIIFSLDAQYRYTAFTVSHQQTMKAIWGVEIELGLNMLELMARPEDREKARANFDRALCGEHFLLTEDYGDELFLRSSWENRYAPIYADNRKVVGLAVFVTDITERTRAQQALKQLNAELEARVEERTAEALDLYHHAPCGYYSLGADGLVLQINDTALHWLGYLREELEGRLRLTELLTPPGGERFNRLYPDFVQRGTTRTTESELRCKDGTLLATLTYAEAHRGAGGQFICTRCTVLDITERRRAEVLLHQAKAAAEAANRARAPSWPTCRTKFARRSTPSWALPNSSRRIARWPAHS